MPPQSLSQSGLGAQLFIGGLTGSGAPVTTPVGEMNDIPMEFNKWATAPTTHLQSTSKTAKPVIPDILMLDCKGNRVSGDAGQRAVMAARSSGQAYDFKLVLPKNPLLDPPQTTGGDTYTWSAFVLGASFAITPESIIPWNINMQVDGILTETLGS